ncbi:MAG: hypothetical protein DRO87_02675 [Candidatus Thorarchaeota archaeon]|nr:MAG: hypothetical protein DRO87_02675 [Candidatus Thorarchaeota archaeon]
MAHELNRLLTHIMTAKRDLKRVYYTARNEDSKSDAKQLVASTITVQRLIEELLTLNRKRRVARKMLGDRKAELQIRRWSDGLPKRVKGYVQKSKKLDQAHLQKYQEALLQYIDSVAEELAKWIEDIHSVAEIPRIPRG